MSETNNDYSNKDKSSNLAASTAKEILLLSTGAIGLSLTFLEKILQYEQIWLLVFGWAFMIISILFGIIFLLNIIGMIHFDGASDIYEKKPRLFFSIHLFSFFFGILFIGIFLSIKTINFQKKESDNQFKIESLNKDFQLYQSGDTLNFITLKDSLKILIKTK